MRRNGRPCPIHHPITGNSALHTQLPSPLSFLPAFFFHLPFDHGQLAGISLEINNRWATRETSYPSRLSVDHGYTRHVALRPKAATFHTWSRLRTSTAHDTLTRRRKRSCSSARAEPPCPCQDSLGPGQGPRTSCSVVRRPPVSHALLCKCRRGLHSQTLCVPNKPFLLNLRRWMPPSRRLSSSWPGEDPKIQWFGEHHDPPRHRPFPSRPSRWRQHVGRGLDGPSRESRPRVWYTSGSTSRFISPVGLPGSPAY